MIRSVRLHVLKEATPISQRSSQPPVALHGPLLALARAIWITVGTASLLLWIVETPLFYHAALQLHNTNGVVTMSPAWWRIGLHRLGLSPTFYAVEATASLYLMTAIMYLVGLVIFLRRSHELIALLVSFMFVNLGVGIISAYAGGPALVHAHPELAGPLALYLNFANVSYLLLYFIPMIFPDGRFSPRWLGWLAVLLAVSTIVPVHLPVLINAPLQVAAFGAIVLSPVYRYLRTSDRLQREQTKWAVFGLVVALGVFLFLSIVQAVFPTVNATPAHKVLLSLVGGTVVYLALCFLPISFGIAILRYKLWEIDVLINRTLVYGALTVSLLALYIGSVIALQALFRSISGQSSNLAVAIATLAVAAIFNPWRERLQSFIDRRFYRRKYDAARILAAFSTHLRDEVDLDQLSVDLLTVIQDTMQPSRTAIWLVPSHAEGTKS